MSDGSDPAISECGSPVVKIKCEEMLAVNKAYMFQNTKCRPNWSTLLLGQQESILQCNIYNIIITYK